MGRLTAAPSLALAALAAAPLAAAVRIAAHVGDPQAIVAIGDECISPLLNSAVQLMKVPNCAGD